MSKFTKWLVDNNHTTSEDTETIQSELSGSETDELYEIFLYEGGEYEIPTAEEFVNQYDWENSTLDIPSVLKEFAKLHVEAALKEAAKNVTHYEDTVDINKQSIINAYDLNLIK